MKKMLSEMKILPILLIILGVTSRLFPHPPNFAPITALALFGAVYLPRKYAFLLPFAALLISDLVIGFYGISMFFVYGSFALSCLVGLWIRTQKNIGTILGGSLLSSILFFLITNFGVWVDPISFYSKDLNGLIQSYIMALPFFRGTLLGDLVYTTIFFGSYELILSFFSKNLFLKRI